MLMHCFEDCKEPPANAAYLQPRSQQCFDPIPTPTPASCLTELPCWVPAQEENPFSWRRCAVPCSDLHGSDALAHPKPCTWSCLGGGDISGTSRLLSSSQAHELLLLGAPWARVGAHPTDCMAAGPWWEPGGVRLRGCAVMGHQEKCSSFPLHRLFFSVGLQGGVPPGGCRGGSVCPAELWGLGAGRPLILGCPMLPCPSQQCCRSCCFLLRSPPPACSPGDDLELEVCASTWEEVPKIK